MNTLLFSRLEQIGTDTEGALRRFAGRYDLYERFLLRFCDDTSLDLLWDAISKKEWVEAFNQAHTLKGVSANLGMTRLYHACSAMTDLLRAQGYDGVIACYAELQAAYEELYQILSQCR